VKVYLTAFIIMIVGLFMAPLLSLKPNRLMPGDPGYLIDIAPLNDILLVLSLLVLFLIFANLLSWNKHLKLFMCLILSAIFYKIITISGDVALVRSEADFLARTAFTTGFWLFVAGYIVVMMQAFATVIEKKYDIKLLIILLTIAPVGLLFFNGGVGEISIFKELMSKQDRFLLEFKNHLLISGSASFSAILIGIPLGIYSFRHQRLSERIFGLLNIVQTIPSIALFGFLIAPFAWLASKSDFLDSVGFSGIGFAPAITALILYGLLPIVRNTYAGISSIDPSVVESAKGMGMTSGQILIKIQLPVSMPLLMNGIRVSFVQCIGNTAVAALVGAGGFGLFIFQGLGQSAVDMVLLGAIPTILLAVFADTIMQFIIKLTSPKGMDYDTD